MAAPAKKAAAPKAAADSGIRVCAPLVQIRLGDRVVHLYQGDVVPDGASQAQLDHLSDLGYVTKGDAPTGSDDE